MNKNIFVFFCCWYFSYYIFWFCCMLFSPLLICSFSENYSATLENHMEAVGNLYLENIHVFMDNWSNCVFICHFSIHNTYIDIYYRIILKNIMYVYKILHRNELIDLCCSNLNFLKKWQLWWNTLYHRFNAWNMNIISRDELLFAHKFTSSRYVILKYSQYNCHFEKK